MIVINELELKQVLKLFWSRKFFIAIMMILFTIIGVVKIKYFTVPEYEASGKLICARSEESISEGIMVTTAELSTTSSLAETYAELIKSDLVVGQVIQNLGLDMTIPELSKSVQLTPVTKVYYKVTVRSFDREDSARIANEFITVFSEEVKKFYEIDSIHIVDKAQVPEMPVNMDLGKTIKIFAGIGFVAAAGIIMLIFVFNNTVTNSEQIKKYTNLTTLATVPKYAGEEDIITHKDSKSPYAESVKILRTNLQYMYTKGDLKTVAITSSLPGEGKSWLTANLAVTFANSGKKTLIIDADMRRGRQYKIFGVKRIPGLSDFLKAYNDNKETVTVKNKKVNNTGFAKILSAINKYIRIEKIPAIYDIIYKEEYVILNSEDIRKIKPLKKESSTEKIEAEVAPEKKTRKTATKKSETKKEEADKPAKKTTKTAKKEKEEAKTKTSSKKVEKKSEPEKETVKQEKVKKTATKKTTTSKKVDSKKEETKKTVAKTKTTKTAKQPKLKISDFINKTQIENLDVLPAGRETMESAELLSTERLQSALKELKKEYDIILIDTPPVSVVADGFIISRVVDTNMIVLKHGNTEISELNKIKNNIEEIGGDVIGTVINKIPNANKKYYNTYYNQK